MHVASFVHSNGSSLFTIIHWPWSMNQRLPVLIQVISINHHQVSVNYFCYHHWTIIKINQVIDEPEIIQCLILQLPAFNTSCHMPWCHFDGKISTNDNTALSRSMIQRDHLQRSINNVINIPRKIMHPTPPHPPPHPALSRSMIQRDHLQRGNNRCAVIGEPGSPRVYIYMYTYIHIWIPASCLVGFFGVLPPSSFGAGTRDLWWAVLWRPGSPN